MKIDPSILKFLKSEYGEKLVRTAELHGQELFPYGKTKYKVSELASWIEAIKQNPHAFG